MSLRLEQLILEVALTPPRALIAEAVDVIAADWKKYAHLYEQDHAGEFIWKGDDFQETFPPVTLTFPDED